MWAINTGELKWKKDGGVKSTGRDYRDYSTPELMIWYSNLSRQVMGLEEQPTEEDLVRLTELDRILSFRYCGVRT